MILGQGFVVKLVSFFFLKALTVEKAFPGDVEELVSIQKDKIAAISLS